MRLTSRGSFDTYIYIAIAIWKRYFVIGYVFDKLEFRLLIFYKGSKFVCKGEVHPRNGREGPEGISSNLALVGVGGERHALTALSLGLTRYLLYRVGLPQDC